MLDPRSWVSADSSGPCTYLPFLTDRFYLTAIAGVPTLTLRRLSISIIFALSIASMFSNLIDITARYAYFIITAKTSVIITSVISLTKTSVLLIIYESGRCQLPTCLVVAIVHSMRRAGSCLRARSILRVAFFSNLTNFLNDTVAVSAIARGYFAEVSGVDETNLMTGFH